jgi:hypothetical protein
VNNVRENNARRYKERYYSEDKTQCDMALEYMKLYGSITPLEALSAFNCLRLGARIADLREDGYVITTDIADGKKKYAVYTLMEEGREYEF